MQSHERIILVSLLLCLGVIWIEKGNDGLQAAPIAKYILPDTRVVDSTASLTPLRRSYLNTNGLSMAEHLKSMTLEVLKNDI